MLTPEYSYEDAVWNATFDYSDHAALRLTELEVFTGVIFNKSGVQTQRQRDRSLQLKDEFDRIAKETEAMIRKSKMKVSGNTTEEDRITTGSDDGLLRSIACLNVGCTRNRSESSGERFGDEFQSFKVIAACCVIREMDAAISRRNVFLRGGSRKGTSIHRDRQRLR